MEAYILVILMLTRDYNTQLSMQEFNSKVSCENAKSIIRNNSTFTYMLKYRHSQRMSTVMCVKK